MSKPLDLQATDPLGVVVNVPGLGRLLAYKAGAPTASAAGFAKGCLFIDVTNGNWYKNTGTSSSATWTAILTGAIGTALTAAAADTVDETYGAEEATVIGNLRTRVGEIEAVLEGRGVVTAN